MISHGLFVRNRADIALVAQVVANASTAALKTEDAPAGSRGRPHARCDVTHGPFAAVGDGKHDDTEAIRSALKQCDSVLLPAGKRFLTGPLNLTSNQASRPGPVMGQYAGS